MDLAGYIGAGGVFSVLIAFFAWQNRQFSLGKWVTKDQKDSEVTALKLGHEQIITALNLSHEHEIANQARRGDEWKAATVALQETIAEKDDIIKKAVEGNRAVDYVFSELLPKLGPRVDNGAQGGTSS